MTTARTIEERKASLEQICRTAGFPAYVLAEIEYSDDAWVSIRFDEVDRLEQHIRAAIDGGAEVDQSDKGLILEIRA